MIAIKKKKIKKWTANIIGLLFWIGVSAAALFAISLVKINYDSTEYLPDDMKTKQSLAVMEAEFGLKGQANVMIGGVDSIDEALRYKQALKDIEDVVIGYRVTNTVTCKIRDINKAGSIIDKAVVAGGDLIRINGINFTVDDPTPFYKIAREKAVQYAMEKARQISQASGTRLGKVLYISEDTSYTPPMVGNYAMKYTAMDSAAAAPTPISAGELEFQVTITMVYEIN